MRKQSSLLKNKKKQNDNKDIGRKNELNSRSDEKGLKVMLLSGAWDMYC